MLVYQECQHSPTRLSDRELRHTHVPCKLSKFEDGGHFLYYENGNENQDFDFSGVSLHHGFGASSLSFLPSLQLICEGVNARCVYAPDAEGFGFGSRSRRSRSRQQQSPFQNQNQSHKPVIIIGHSMGCREALRVAASTTGSSKKIVLLVAPAIIKKKIQQKKTLRFPSRLKSLITLMLYPPFRLLIKRIVASERFWRSGLSKAMTGGVVSDDVVQRYRLPSLVQGWERGLFDFVTRKGKDSGNEGGKGGWELLSSVASETGTRVIILHGKEDSIISVRNSKKLIEGNDQIELVELEGVGHVPHEEDVNLFVDCVKKVCN